MQSYGPPLPGGSTISRQLLQQRFGLLQVGGVKALGEPAVDLRQELVSGSTPALTLSQATQAHGGPQLPRLGLALARYGKGLLEAGFGCLHLRDGLPQQ